MIIPPFYMMELSVSDLNGGTKAHDKKKKSDASGITLLAKPRNGARVAPQRCPILRYG